MERKLAIISIVVAIVHFVGESYWHIKFGQFLPMLIVDYIAVSLLLFAGVRSLQTGRAIGLMCGACFEFCLNYRTFFWRVEVLLNGNASSEIESLVYLLGTLLVFTFTLFIITLYLCNVRASKT